MSLRKFFFSLTLILSLSLCTYAQKSKTLSNDDFNSSNNNSTHSTNTTPSNSAASNTSNIGEFSNYGDNNYIDESLSYSADLVLKNNSGKDGTAKVSFDKGKYRIEIIFNQKDHFISISNPKDKKKIMLLPERKQYMADISGDILTIFLGQTDPQYRELVGTEEINGQTCDKYILNNKAGNFFGKTYLWISKNSKIATRMKIGNDQIDWSNITLGPQPDNLFQIPSGYKDALDVSQYK